MNASGVTVSLKLLGKEYLLACPPEERESLLTAAEDLDRRMNAVRASGRVIGSERIAVLAALDLAHELLLLKRGRRDEELAVAERIRGLQRRIEQALAEGRDEA